MMRTTVLLLVLAGLGAMAGCGNNTPPPASIANVQEAPAPDNKSKESEQSKPVETLDDALLGRSLFSESTVVPDINGGAIIVTGYGVWHVDRLLGAKRLREAMPSNSAGALPRKTLGKLGLFSLWQADSVKFRRVQKENQRLQEEIEDLQSKLEEAEREKEPSLPEDIRVTRPSKSNKPVLARNRKQ